jgi:hypothetical protein
MQSYMMIWKDLRYANDSNILNLQYYHGQCDATSNLRWKQELYGDIGIFKIGLVTSLLMY